VYLCGNELIRKFECPFDTSPAVAWLLFSFSADGSQLSENPVGGQSM
jgi:hypothetical protein